MGVEFPHQVAGHEGQLLCDPSDPHKVIKLCQPKEKDFYEAIFSRESLPPWKIALRPWLPMYYGNSKGGTCISLENLVGSYVWPSIVDIKLGSVLYDDDASDDKKWRLSQVSAETTSGSMGMRICGMKVFDTRCGVYRLYDKAFGRSQTATTFTSTFRERYLLGSTTLASSLYSQIIDLIDVLENAHVRLISSSAILIYESSPTAVTSTIQPLVRLIDFAHSITEEGIGKDEGVIFGLQSLARVLQECM